MLELAKDSAQDPASSAEALALARDAAGQLLGRLRVLRAAWSSVADWPDDGFANLVSSLNTDRLRLKPDAATLAFARQAATGRLLLNVALLGMELLGQRGTVLLHAEPEGVAAMLVPTPPARAALWPNLDGLALGAPEPPRFQQAWTALVAQAQGILLRPNGPILHLLLSA